jgi:hypothetical protein
MKQLIEDREKEIDSQGLPERPTILDLLVSSRLQDPEFAAIASEDLVTMILGISFRIVVLRNCNFLNP